MPSYGEAQLVASLSNGVDFVDSGKTRRPLLPFQTAQRGDIRGYYGLAPVLDAQVMCGRPSLGSPAISFNAHLPIVTGLDAGDNDPIVAMLTGSISWPSSASLNISYGMSDICSVTYSEQITFAVLKGHGSLDFIWSEASSLST